MKLLLLCLAAFIPALVVGAEIILEDGFSYSDGLIVGAGSPWSVHSGTSGDALVASGKLELVSSRSDDINAPLLGAPYSTNSAAFLYASFTVHFTALPTSAGTYFAHFNASNFRALISAKTSGAPAGTFRVGIANTTSGVNVQLTNNLILGQEYFLVARYGRANGLSTLWLNPVAETNSSVTAFDSANPIAIGTFAFRQSSGSGAIKIDNLKVGTSFADVASTNSITAPEITTHPQSQTVFAGTTVAFEVAAQGTGPLNYQWRFNESEIPNASGATLVLTNVTSVGGGNYDVLVSNAAGFTNSHPATLIVNPRPAAALSVISYNTHGNQIEDWSINSPQVQAIGRQMSFLNPDVVAFQEIPLTNTYQMTNFVKRFLPGYFLASNSGTDGFIRSVIASRFPITRSAKWLDGADLKPFGYTNDASNADNFTRDLFEAQIAVPQFAEPVHIFTTHLKSSGDLNSRSKRAAEASAISNFFVTSFLTTNAHHPYLLTGDLNEDIARPSGTEQTIQRLANAATGLKLTTPLNPATSNELTFSIQATTMTRRYDYILPGGLLFSNIVSSQVFRSDLLNPVPPQIQANDSKTASDHLPVMMVFGNPYLVPPEPLEIFSVNFSNQLLTLHWRSFAGEQYRVESSTTLTNWISFSEPIMATGTNTLFSTNTTSPQLFLRINRLPPTP